MIHHSAIAGNSFACRRRLVTLIQQGAIGIAGNRTLKIYGTLHCAAGKRMKMANRVFFATAAEAMENGYRPCGCCLRKDYLVWRENIR